DISFAFYKTGGAHVPKWGEEITPIAGQLRAHPCSHLCLMSPYFPLIVFVLDLLCVDAILTLALAVTAILCTRALFSHALLLPSATANSSLLTLSANLSSLLDSADARIHWIAVRRLW